MRVDTFKCPDGQSAVLAGYGRHIQWARREVGIPAFDSRAVEQQPAGGGLLPTDPRLPFSFLPRVAALSVERSAILKTMITTSCTTSSVQRRTVLRVRAGAGEWRGPWQRRRESFRILARSAEGRGRSTGPVARPDSTLLSVLPFMDNSVCDGGHIHSEVSSQPSS